MDTAESILLGLIVTLTLGGYGYAYMLGRDLRRDIGKLWTYLHNHQQHRFDTLEQRVDRLEKKDDLE